MIYDTGDNIHSILIRILTKPDDEMNQIFSQKGSQSVFQWKQRNSVSDTCIRDLVSYVL